MEPNPDSQPPQDEVNPNLSLDQKRDSELFSFLDKNGNEIKKGDEVNCDLAPFEGKGRVSNFKTVNGRVCVDISFYSGSFAPIPTENVTLAVLSQKQKPSQPPPTPESGIKKNPADVIREMGFKFSYRPVFNPVSKFYEEGEEDLDTANKAVEALKILGINSRDQIKIDHFTIGHDTTFFARSILDNEILELYVSADKTPQQLADFIKFATEAIGDKNSISFADFEEAKERSSMAQQEQQEPPQPLPTPTPALDQLQPAAPTLIPNVPEWEKGEEWENLYDARKKYAKAEGEYKKYIEEHDSEEYKATKKGAKLSDDELNIIVDDFDVAQEEYYRCLNAVGLKIKEKISGNSGTGPLTPEQQANLTSEINDAEMQFVKDERAYYKFIFNSQKEKTALDKGLEKVRSALDNRVVRWYLRQNKWIRLGATTVLFTAGGYALGTAAVGGTILSAAGYGIGRGLRGTAAIVGGGFARAAAEKRWSEEDIDKKIKEEEESIKNSQESLEEKSKRYAELEAFGEKEKKWARIKKGIVAVGVGAGAGVLAGLTEHAVTGGGAARSAVESGGGKGGGVRDHLPGRKGFGSDMSERLQVPRSETTEQTAVRSGVTEQTPESSPTVSETAAETTEPTEASTKIISDPKVLVHEVESGDSNWGILKKALDNNDRFSKLSHSGQKSFVLSCLNNKVLEDPGQYGIDPDGGVTIGKTVDYSKLFEDQKWVNSILEKAEKLSDAKIDTIEENDASIAAFVKAYPDVRITSDKIDEILSGKTEEGIISPEIPKTEPINMQKPGILDIEKQPIPPYIEPVESTEADLGRGSVAAGAMLAGATGFAKGADGVKSEDIAKELKELEIAKQRLTVLEGGRELNQSQSQNQKPALPGLRSKTSDSRLALEKGKISPAEEVFKGAIDGIFGHRLLVFGKKTGGENSKRWKIINGYTAEELVQYTKGEEDRNKLPKDLLEALNSGEGGEFIKSFAKLREEGKGLNPDPHESPKKYIIRVIEFISRKRQAETSELAIAA